MNTLRNRLTISYIFLALSIIISISVLFNIMIDKLFMQYALNKQEKQVEQIVSQINLLYEENTGLYNQASLEIIGNAALQNGLILHIRNLKGEIDWDVRQHNFGQCQIILQHAENNMHSLYPKFKGKYSENSFEISDSNGVVGFINVGFYGPYSLNDEEIYLITTINKILIAITIAALILAIVLGLYMSKRLTISLSDVVKTAKEISKGRFGIQVTSIQRQKVTELVTSINDLSNELNRTEMLKRRLTSDIAHELRTPLTNLQSHTEAMIDGVFLPNKERLQGLYDEIKRITKIVNDLQKLSSIEEEHIILQKKWFNAFDFLHYLYTIFQIEFDKNKSNSNMIALKMKKYMQMKID